MFEFKKKSVLPYFKLSLAYSVFYLLIIVVIPLSMLFVETSSLSMNEFVEIISDERVVASYKLTIRTALIASLFNGFFGIILCWVIVRYDFFGKKILNSVIDLPFALPTAVAGIALTAIYSKNGAVGGFLNDLGIEVAFTPNGIIVALIFVGIPFIVRTVEPVLRDFDKEIEEAAASLGATRMQTFTKLIIPHVGPALLTGFSLAFARSIGEYGSVIFIAGNIPMISEIVPLVIHIKLEQYDYKAATSIAIIMLCFSFFMLLVINLLQKYVNR